MSPVIHHRTFRAALGLVASLWLVTGCGGDRQRHRDHIALWESVRRSSTNIGNSFALDASGVAIKYIVSMGDYRYRVAGDSLWVRPIPPDSLHIPIDSVPERAFVFRRWADTLFKDDGRMQSWLTPSVGSVEPGGLTGNWRVARMSGTLTVHSYERFSEDGLWQVRLPMQMRRGAYEQHGDTLTFRFPDEEVRVFIFEIHGDTLSMTRVGEKNPGVYVRSADRAWYFLSMD